MATEEVELQVQGGTFLTEVEEEVDSFPHPFDDPNRFYAFCCRLTHIWQLIMFVKGAKRPLEPGDVPRVPEDDRLENLTQKYEENLAQREQDGEEFSVYKALCARERPLSRNQVFHQLLAMVYSAGVPIMMSRLTGFYASSDEPLMFGILFACLLVLFSFLRALHESLSWIAFARIFVRIRSSLMHFVYKKALKMSKFDRQETSTGKTVNLMSQDAETIGLGLACIPLFFIYFAMLMLCLGLMIWQVGWAGVIGWCAWILSVPVTGYFGAKMFSAMTIMKEHADHRVKFINEVLQGVRVTKLYAWEVPLMKVISDIRNKEMAEMLKRAYYDGWFSGTSAVMPGFVILLTLGSHVLLGGTVDVATTFTVLSIVNLMRIAILFLPFAFLMSINAMVALSRMTPYLKTPDLEPRCRKPPESSSVAIEMTNATFSWAREEEEKKDEDGDQKDDADDMDKNDEDAANAMNLNPKGEVLASSSVGMATDGETNDMDDGQTTDGNATTKDMDEEKKTSSPTGPTLFDMTLAIPPGSLVGIVGSVGAGKSSVVNALLGEMVLVDGTYSTNGSVAYTSQTPFIFNATVKDNILFGRPLDRDKYKMAVKSSELTSDLRIFANGDETEIGERGVNLSGGQKARVGLARALYRHDETDIYLFDDPLSAVDMHVGETMFHEGINGTLLREKTRVIVMNSHLHLLAHCDMIMVMDHGHLVTFDTYENILNSQDPKIQDFHGLITNDMNVREGDVEELPGPSDMEYQVSDPRQTTSFTMFEKQKKAKIDKGDITANLIQEEDRQTGNVQLHVYVKYFASALGDLFDFSGDEKDITYERVAQSPTTCSGRCALSLVLVSFVTMTLVSGVSAFWISLFSERDNARAANTLPFLNRQSLGFWLGIYAAIVVFEGFLQILSRYLAGRIAVRSSFNIHMQALYSVLRAPISFFDATPIGRIVNRFSGDTEQMDAHLPSTFAGFLSILLNLILSVLIVCAIVPFVLLLVIPLGIILYRIQNFYRASSRELKRLAVMSRSPIYAQFTETLNGVTTIRAFEMGADFLRVNGVLVNKAAKLSLQYQLSERWLGVNLEFATGFVLLAVALLGVFLRNLFPPALISLAVIYSQGLSGLIQWAVMQYVQVENSLTSVERILHYTDADQVELESEEVSLPQFAPPPDWPANGEIEFDHLEVRYREDLPLVLKGITCRINSCEKVGICGRTGAGKSTIMSALFRLVEAEGSGGSILIDGVDIAKIGLRDLRKALSIIPQDPVLFSGTVRFNLDPFDSATDDEVIEVLRKVHLHDYIMNSEEKLDFNVAESGENFSVGQRQLICIGRALLRHTKVMLLDEATASIDNKTDALIQETIRENFGDRTVLTIAHRLDTIMDSDRILVLDAGKIVEFDTPANLMNIDGGVFAAMVETGK